MVKGYVKAALKIDFVFGRCFRKGFKMFKTAEQEILRDMYIELSAKDIEQDWIEILTSFTNGVYIHAVMEENGLVPPDKGFDTITFLSGYDGVIDRADSLLEYHMKHNKQLIRMYKESEKEHNSYWKKDTSKQLEDTLRDIAGNYMIIWAVYNVVYKKQYTLREMKRMVNTTGA